MDAPLGFLTIDDAAKELNCSRNRVERMLWEGQLPRHVNPIDRRRVLIARSAVDGLKNPTPLPERRRIRAVA